MLLGTTYYVLTMAGVLLDAPHSVTVVAQSEVRLLSIHKVDIFSVGDAGVIERLTQVPGRLARAPKPPPLLPNSARLLAAIDPEEVKAAIKAGKNWKAFGGDQVAAELLKSGGTWVINWLTMLFNWCLNQKYIPQDWKDSIIINLFKGKGDAGHCSNYRGITLLSVIGKCFSHILVRRIVSVADFKLLDQQFGFRKFRSTQHASCILQRIIESSELQKLGLHALFIDLEKAFDTVPRKHLWKILENRGLPS